MANGAGGQRAERRRSRMLDGLVELDQWLGDQTRNGLAGSDRASSSPFDALAARLVDAQLPGVAGKVRELAATARSGDGWQGRLLAEYGLLHLLARAAPSALDDPGSAFGATVRAHLGVGAAKDDVLAGPAVRDRWVVLGLRDDLEDRLTVRRVWLRGIRTERLAVVLSFAVREQLLDATLVPGTVIDAQLHFYPGDVPLRALVGARFGAAAPAGDVPGTSMATALAGWAAALAADPWLPAWPVVLDGVVPVVEIGQPRHSGHFGPPWWLVDPDGSLPLLDTDEHTWALLAASGGLPITLLAEIVPGGVRAVTVLGAGGRDQTGAR